MAKPYYPGKTYTKSTTVQRPVRGGGFSSLVTEYDRVAGWRQLAPIDTALSYVHVRSSVTKWIGHAYSEDGASWEPQVYSDRAWLLSKAYESMRGNLFDSIELGANLAEYRESHGMVFGTLSTLIGVGRDFRKGDLVSAARRLKLRNDRPRKVNPKRLGDLSGASRQIASYWLGYVFGVEPLLKDLYEGLDVLQQPLKSLKGKGRADSGLFKSLSNDTVTTYPSTGTVKTYAKHRQEQYRCQVSCLVRVSNPHLHFLEQSGLLNPASVVWEVVPFSFLADWVSNVGSSIRRMSDFAGLTVRFPCFSETHRWQCWSSDAQTSRIDGNFYCSTRSTGVRFVRGMGFPSNTLALKPLALPSAKRIATASALLVALMPR